MKFDTSRLQLRITLPKSCPNCNGDSLSAFAMSNNLFCPTTFKLTCDACGSIVVLASSYDPVILLVRIDPDGGSDAAS